MLTEPALTVIGGGLAGCEAAWQAAQRGVSVTLYEMRPFQSTPAHQTEWLGELVCSNSLGSNRPDRAGGLLKAELRRLGSMVLAAAESSSVPAGAALAVDRERFASAVTSALTMHPNVRLVREEVTRLPDGQVIVATGPLTSPSLADHLAEVAGSEHLYFYDALSPIVAADSIDLTVAFRQSRWGRGEIAEGDYINCPMSQDEFDGFVAELTSAERIELRDFEREDGAFFEACLPIEVLAQRSPRALRFGPMRPVGLRDPRTDLRPFAVVQLRQDNAAGTLYNIVGFQTNLKWPEQRRVLRMIPGLAEARFERLGQMHRNTFINAPRLLEPTMGFRGRPELSFAGQITGIEGYVGNIGSGLVAGINAARRLHQMQPIVLPADTMLGALCRYVTSADPEGFQPMKANFGLLPPMTPPVRSKAERYQAYADRALASLERFVADTACAEPMVGGVSA